MNWIPFPFIRYTLILMTGILMHRYFSAQVPIVWVYGTFFLLTLLYMLAFRYGKRRFWLSTLGLFTLVPFGYLLTSYHTESNHREHLLQTKEVTAYVGKVRNEVYFKGNTWRADLEVEQVKTAGGWKQASGKVRLFIAPEDSTSHKPVKYQDRLLIAAPPQRPMQATNPYAFDYRSYLANKNIYHTHFLRPNDYKLLEEGSPHSADPVAWGIRIRAHSRQLLSTFLEDEQSIAIASALLIGVKDRIDQDLRAAYAGAGAMHILAVSGLHVGIVFGVLSYLFTFLGLARRPWLTTAILVFTLWGYALITGFSPSVLRAVTMFSIIGVAKLFQRNNITYNSIGLSAFLLLLVRPQFLFEVGFQLSYIAVLGIVFLYPRWEQTIRPSHWITKYFWGLIIVSLAAQLATFPLSVFYFHQFPNYFLLTNMLVLPWVFVVLSLGLLFLATGGIPVLGDSMGLLLDWSLRLMNQGIIRIEELPYAVSRGLYLTSLETLTIYIALIAFFFFWYGRRRMAGWFSLALVLFLVGQHIIRIEQKRQEQELTVYDLPAPNLSLREGQYCYFWADTSRQSLSAKDLRYATEAHQVQAYVEDKLEVSSQKMSFGRLWVWRGRRILQLTEMIENPPSLDLEVLILSEGTARYAEKLAKKMNWKHLIIDRTNSFRDVQSLPQGAHLVSDRGAFSRIYLK